MERVLPLIRKYGAAVVAISNDDTGISEDPDVRFAVAKRIVERAADHGIPAADIVVDPLRHADRRDGERRAPGVRAGPPAHGGARRQLDLRRLERQLRAAEPRGHQRRVPADGDRVRDDVGDHEPDDAGRQGRGHGRRRPDGPRPRLRPLDPPQSRTRRRKARSAAPGEPPTPARRPPSRVRASRPPEHDAPRRGRATPLVIFTPSGRRGRVRDRHDRARRRAVPRRRHRFGVRRARDLRPLPGTQASASSRSTGSPPPPATSRRSRSSKSTYRAEKGLAADRRLSCTAQVCGDVLIDVPPESQVHRQVVRKGLDVRTFSVDPVVRLHYVEVTPPELASPTGDLVRLFEALEREWELTTSRPTSRSSVRSSRRSKRALRRDGRGPRGRTRSSASGPASTRRRTGSRSTSARRRSPGTSPTWPTARSSPATA